MKRSCTIVTPVYCLSCANFMGLNVKSKPACIAYPGGIPSAIIDGERPHVTPWKQDNTAVYEPLE